MFSNFSYFSTNIFIFVYLCPNDASIYKFNAFLWLSSFSFCKYVNSQQLQCLCLILPFSWSATAVRPIIWTFIKRVNFVKDICTLKINTKKHGGGQSSSSVQDLQFFQHHTSNLSQSVNFCFLSVGIHWKKNKFPVLKYFYWAEFLLESSFLCIYLYPCLNKICKTN